MQKKFYPLIIIPLIVIIDQILKLWIKTNMYPGEHFAVSGDWFYIYFTENNGMAFGLELAGEYGKLSLSIMRLLAITGIGWLLIHACKRGATSGFIISISMIFAGALGNIIDSVFYGIFFDYAGILHGKVVDMFYFPLIEGVFPKWIPVWGNEDFIFFRPVFNIADSSITTGVTLILFFHKGLPAVAVKESVNVNESIQSELR